MKYYQTAYKTFSLLFEAKSFSFWQLYYMHYDDESVARFLV